MEPTVYAVGEASDPALRSLGTAPRVAPTTGALVERVLRDEPAGTGLFLSTDQETAALYHAMAANGVAAGNQYVVVSCDNEIPTLAPLNPRPATIDFGARQIGQQAVRRLLHRVRNPAEPTLLIQLPPRLVLPGEAPPHAAPE
jgi:DNA-binding LacI/PurR family transcriptional regulator